MRKSDYDIFLGFKPDLENDCLVFYSEREVQQRDKATQGASKGHWWTLRHHWSGKIHAFPGFSPDAEDVQGWAYTETPAPLGKRKLKVEG